MENVVALSLFLPREVLKELTCAHLFGYYSFQSSNLVVSCTISIITKKRCEDFRLLHQTIDIEHSESIHNTQLKFLGIIYFSEKKSKTIKQYLNTHQNQMLLILRVDGSRNSYILEKSCLNINHSFQLILYDRLNFCDSQLLHQVMVSRYQSCFIPFLISSLTKSFYPILNFPCSFYCKVSYLSANRNNLKSELISYQSCVKIFDFSSCFLSFWWYQALLKIICCTHFGRQIHLRLLHTKSIFLESKTQNMLSLKCKNLLSSIFFDVLFGLLITFIFLKTDWLIVLLKYAVDNTNDIVNGLQKLIYWLMGIPAGLKLNIPLNSAMGHFFLYHIYLWKAYMTIVLPVFYLILKMVSVIGIFGFTFFLCLLSDLVSLATIHIYCFYGYATRVYGYQISCLSALWRLFRGKKWNPLRQRVDSYSYDIHQLYLGTLLFTVLLFLLPTVLVYYFVFMCLRMLVLIIQGIMTKAIEFFSILPIYSIVLRLLNSPKTNGDVNFSVFNSQASLVLSMELIQAPILTVIKETLPEIHEYGEKLSWKELVLRLVTGIIIYPL